MANRTPDVKQTAVSAAGTATLTWTQLMSCAHIKNNGAGNVYVKFNGTPGAAPADGQFTLEAGEVYNIDDTSFLSIGFYGVASCQVEVVAYISAEGVRLV